jgi:hypothetical protein
LQLHNELRADGDESHLKNNGNFAHIGCTEAQLDGMGNQRNFMSRRLLHVQIIIF